MDPLEIHHTEDCSTAICLEFVKIEPQNDGYNTQMDIDTLGTSEFDVQQNDVKIESENNPLNNDDFRKTFLPQLIIFLSSFHVLCVFFPYIRAN